jgi:hypothetical protein
MVDDAFNAISREGYGRTILDTAGTASNGSPIVGYVGLLKSLNHRKTVTLSFDIVTVFDKFCVFFLKSISLNLANVFELSFSL